MAFPAIQTLDFPAAFKQIDVGYASPEHVVGMAIVFLGDAISILQLLCCLSQDVQNFIHSRWCRIYQQYCQYTQEWSITPKLILSLSIIQLSTSD